VFNDFKYVRLVCIKSTNNASSSLNEDNHMTNLLPLMLHPQVANYSLDSSWRCNIWRNWNFDENVVL